MIDDLRRGGVDLALVGCANRPPEDLASLVIVSEGLVAVVPPSHELAHRSTTTLGRVLMYPIVCMPPGTWSRLQRLGLRSSAGDCALRTPDRAQHGVQSPALPLEDSVSVILSTSLSAGHRSEVAEETDFGIPSESGLDEVRHLGDDENGIEEWARMLLEKLKTLGVVAVVCVDVGVQRPGVDQERYGRTPARRISSIRSEMSDRPPRLHGMPAHQMTEVEVLTAASTALGRGMGTAVLSWGRRYGAGSEGVASARDIM